MLGRVLECLKQDGTLRITRDVLGAILVHVLPAVNWVIFAAHARPHSYRPSTRLAFSTEAFYPWHQAFGALVLVGVRSAE